MVVESGARPGAPASGEPEPSRHVSRDATPARGTERLDSLLRLIVCPDCRKALARQGIDSLECAHCSIQYAIDDGVPVLLSERTRDWSPKLAYRDNVPAGSLHDRLRRVGILKALVHRYRNLTRFLHLPSDWAPGPNIQKLIERCGAPRPALRVLDVGGGSGYYRGLFEKERGEVFGLDIARFGGVDVIGNAYALPFPSESFDVVCLFQVLEHLYSPARAIQECGRVLVKGGRLLLTAPQFSHVHGWPGDYFRYTNFGLRHLGEQAGLAPIAEWPMGGRFAVAVTAIGNCFNMSAGPLRYAPFSLMSFLATLLDRTFHRWNLASANPDTVGWAMALVKGEGPA